MNINFSKGQWIVLRVVGILLSVVSVLIGLTIREHLIGFGGSSYRWTFSSLIMTLVVPIILLGGLFFLSLSNKDK
jgi:hypothetical protein